MKSAFYRVPLTAAFVSCVVALSSPAGAHHPWSTYHWARTSNPFTLQLGDNVSSAWDSYLATTASTSSYGWGSSAVLDLRVVSGRNLSNLRKCPPASGRVEICSYRYGTNGWLGVAQIWLSGGHIYQGTVKLNDSYFDNSKYPKYNSPQWRNLVMCQEVGHIFGLDHQDQTFSNPNLGTCMDYTSDPDGPPTNEYPNAHDYEQLEIIYNGHVDTATTVGQIVQARGKGKTPPGPGSPDDDGEIFRVGTAQWGRLVKSTNRGRTELYELDLGGGHKLLTRVIWADPEEEAEPERGRR
ncbi:MAG TPA: hypothetical protein VNN77_00185 [candidate division Zixibacteria bacterium]|nr:hypothetical protein [candidate division Zixibacteria bacterium]